MHRKSLQIKKRVRSLDSNHEQSLRLPMQTDYRGRLVILKPTIMKPENTTTPKTSANPQPQSMQQGWLDLCLPIVRTDSIGNIHIDVTEVPSAEGYRHLFVGVDPTSKLVVAKLVKRATRRSAADFVRKLIDATPHKIRTVQTDNGQCFRSKVFQSACAEQGIIHRYSKPAYPQVNNRAERMIRTIRDAIVGAYH
jgi:transposase InsO family protein